MKIKIIAALLAVLAAVTVIVMVPAMADTETAAVPAVVIESKNVAKAEAGETVSVSVDLVATEDCGVVTMTIPVTWDTEVLELIDIENRFVILTEEYVDCNGWLGSDDYASAQENGVYYLAWDNDLAERDFTESGTLCVMTFRILKDFEETVITPVMSGDDILPIANIMNYAMNDRQNDFVYEKGTLTAGGEEAKTVTVKGTITSFGDDTAPITVELYQIDSEGNEAFYDDRTVSGNSASYEFTGVTPGNYTVKISKPNHVTRTYQITVSEQ